MLHANQSKATFNNNCSLVNRQHCWSFIRLFRQQDAAPVAFPCAPVRHPTHLQRLGNMVTHASRQPPRNANSVFSSAWKKAKCPALLQKRWGTITQCKTGRPSTDFHPDALKGLSLIRWWPLSAPEGHWDVAFTVCSMSIPHRIGGKNSR